MTKNRATPEFTDEEVLTVYLFGLTYERKSRVKDCYDYIANHWLDCFPKLPSYQAFNNRLNRLAGIMPRVVEILVQKYRTDNSEQAIDWVLTDSMPIITCSGKRRGKVATELCNKGYNSTKNLHFFGVKLHGLGYYRPGKLPLLEYLYLSPASMHDLEAQRDILQQDLSDKIVIADKAFVDEELGKYLQDNGGALLCPVKYKKGQPVEDRQRQYAADNLFSKAVSKVRQPIESFFNWLIEHTDIQRASKVRSYTGLLAHVFGRIAAAFILISNLSV